jgi:endonuclease/exonuclease/phosphatase family metal-dependent hydrolase
LIVKDKKEADMNRVLLFFLLFGVLNCENQDKDIDDPGWETETPTQRIKVMSYNVKYCSPYNSTTPNVDSVAGVIRETEPDIVLLQELDRNTTRSGKVDQLALLSKRTDLPYTWYGKAIDYQGGESGLGILSRYTLTDTQIFHLPRVEIPDTYVSYRILITAIISVSGQKVTIGNTHLELTQENRDLQVPEINKILSAFNYPVILGGDFNATPDNNTMQTFFSYGFKKTCTKGCNTITSFAPNREIDYIIYRPESKFNVVSHEVIRTMASDHMPIVTEIEVNE